MNSNATQQATVVTDVGGLFAVALGGALGSLARHYVTVWFELWLGRDFPYGILFANVFGSILIGILYVLLLEKTMLSDFWRSLLMIGFLGAFTTFSTFSLQTIALIEDGRLAAAVAYTLGSVALSIMGAWMGIAATRGFVN